MRISILCSVLGNPKYSFSTETSKYVPEGGNNHEDICICVGVLI